MIDTRDFTYSTNMWLQAIWAIRHPINFIKNFKQDMYSWSSLAGTLRKYWMKIYTRLPFQKACRWLGAELIDRVSDSKLLDNFECRTRGKITKYYFATCHFGYIKFEEKQYIYKGKTCNLFMDFTVAGLVGDKSAKKKAEQTKTQIKVIYKGWVFTKKKAFRMLRDIINKNPKIYKSEWQNYPEVAIPYLVEYPINMLEILKTGKCKDNTIDDMNLRMIYMNSKDNIEKLWCYVMHLLSCRNDFKAHAELADIASSCDWYLFNKTRIKDPTVDSFYESLIKQGKEKQAKNYIQSVKKDNKNYKENSILEIKDKIDTLKKYYLSIPYSYYRC